MDQDCRVSFDHIHSQEAFVEYCRGLEQADTIAFDTEFVSEDRYRPDLCLLQVAANGRFAVIDTQVVKNLQPFWEIITSGEHQTIVHAGREELQFCLHAIGRRPHELFDVPIAAALVGLEYPAAYGTLVDRLLGCSLPKGETRTDWRRRPLSHRQLEYAVKDVEFLGPLWQELSKRLKNLGRRDWLDTEMTAWQQQIEHDTSEARWRRVSGSAGLNTRQLAIVRELWKWRDNEAERRDRPARRVLRDDLIVELARRGTADEGRISAVRGLNRRDVQKHVSNLSTCIHAALELPEEELPERHRRAASSSQLNLLSQFLSTALASICRAAQVAPSLVGTVQDVRDLVAFRLKPDRASMSPPALATGWRAEIVGQTIDDLLAGKLSIRITDPLSDHPLEFESND